MFRNGDKIICIKNDTFNEYAMIELNKEYTFSSYSLDSDDYILIREKIYKYPLGCFTTFEEFKKLRFKEIRKRLCM